MSPIISASNPKIIIAGGTGFLGQSLAKSFLRDGYEVVILSRRECTSFIHGRIVRWDARSIGEWTDELNEANILVNLTGKSIDCRHTRSNRQEILDSRVNSTKVLGNALHLCKKPPLVWLNASSMSLYGQCFGNEPAYDENSPIQASGFLEEVTLAWENEFFKFENLGVRQIALRISFVLGHKSGAFPMLKYLAKLGLGGKQGSGNQWMSWLHEDDWVEIIRFLCQQDSVHGPINLSSPHPVTNFEFMKTLRDFVAPLGIGLPAPDFGVKIGCALLGSAPELALQSRRVISETLNKINFKFKYPTLEEALKNLLS